MDWKQYLNWFKKKKVFLRVANNGAPSPSFFSNTSSYHTRLVWQGSCKTMSAICQFDLDKEFLADLDHHSSSSTNSLSKNFFEYSKPDLQSYLVVSWRFMNYFYSQVASWIQTLRRTLYPERDESRKDALGRASCKTTGQQPYEDGVCVESG